MPRAPKLPKVDTEERFLAQVAWAYYVEGLTQEGVADKLRRHAAAGEQGDVRGAPTRAGADHLQHRLRRLRRA